MRVKSGNSGKDRLAKRAAAICTRLQKGALGIPAETSVEAASTENGADKTGPGRGTVCLSFTRVGMTPDETERAIAALRRVKGLTMFLG